MPTAWEKILMDDPFEVAEDPKMYRNKPNTNNPKCEICGTRDDVTLAPDPYRAEINEDYTPRHLCKKCRAERREEI